MKKTPLNEVHRKSGARMVEFAGWEMPVQYESALQEHLAVRQSVGVFDVSHMGEIEISGRDAFEMLQHVTCNDVSRLSDGQAQYSAFLYPDGTFVDDIVVYRLEEERFLICVNAANTARDFAWLQQHRAGGAEVKDISHQYTQLAVQGPRSEALLQELVDVDLSSLPYYHFALGRVCDERAIISRTGYTGEDGFELYFDPGSAERVWGEIFRVGERHGVRAAGLAARNTLRLEMKYSLYGNDINDTTSPLEAGLGWIVRLSKPDFVGKPALVQQKEHGVSRKLIGFEMVGRGIARDGYPVFLKGQQIGTVNSGGFGPSVEKAIGMTYLPVGNSTVGSSFEIGIRGKIVEAQVVATPFYSKKEK